ncbi:hypothetical protein, partial [Endozoicomonas acroporae]|uniref:hypothetical protein n=1 Tax=Endozoicomonas acroporae TaxID=1701104 RepID=UPI003D79374D
MQFQINKIKNADVGSWCVFFLVLAAGLLSIFDLQIVKVNNTIFYQSINIDLVYVFFLCVFILIAFLYIPTFLAKPIDLFLYFYFFIVLYAYFIFHSIRGELDNIVYILNLIILVFPAVVVLNFSYFFRRFSFSLPLSVKSECLVLVFVVLSLCSVFFSLLNPTPSASFGLEDSYIRRLEGREIYAFRSPLAYLNSMVMNGILPFLAFYSGWKLRLFLFAFCSICWIVFYYLLGVKAPLFFIFISFFIGCCVRANKIRYLLSCISVLAISSVFFSLIEFALFDYSYVADYLLRRALTVPP